MCPPRGVSNLLIYQSFNDHAFNNTIVPIPVVAEPKEVLHPCAPYGGNRRAQPLRVHGFRDMPHLKYR